MNGRFTPETIR